jgi:hypothetical protein
MGMKRQESRNEKQETSLAGFAEILFSKATGFCPSLIIDNCELNIGATGGRN